MVRPLPCFAAPCDGAARVELASNTVDAEATNDDKNFDEGFIANVDITAAPIAAIACSASYTAKVALQQWRTLPARATRVAMTSDVAVSTIARSTSRLIFLLSVAAGISAANLYYAQPLAEVMARDFHATAAAVSSALVATQIGYALGMLFLVPLGDVRERRWVIVVTACGASIALLLIAASHSIALLTVTSVMVGLGASVTQMILPFAVGLAAPDQRGRVVGNVMGGLLAGILLSRTVGGMLGAAIGWRGVFVIAAAAMAVLAALLRIVLPRVESTTRLSYRQLLTSLVGIAAREPVLRARCLVGGLGFASFSVFWSTIAFQVSSPAIGRGSATAGMLGAVGLTGVVVAPIAGRLAMRVTPSRVNIGALLVLAASFAVFAMFADSLLAIAVGVVLLDAGVQASHLTNQTVIFGIDPAERSRLNAIYMVAYFVGGAVGTAIAAQAWQRGGWNAVCAVGFSMAVLAIVPLLRRTPRNSLGPAA